MNSRRIFPLMMALLVLAGCGHKGAVQPRKQQLPAAPQALTVQQKGTRFLVAWNRPRTNQDGSPLTDLEGFRIFKMKYDLAQDCPECRDTSVLLLDVDLEYLRDVRHSGDRFYLWDDALEAGFGYQYRVVPYNAKGRDGDSVGLRVPSVDPPATPDGLTAESHDQLVRLRWQPAAETRAGVELLGYNLYRREADEPFPFEPVNRAILTEPAYEDYGVQNGHTYIYTVRTVVRSRGNTVESHLSKTVEARPHSEL